MIHFLLIFFYIVVCVFLILVVLLQTGKRADLAGAFGGGGSQTALGTRGAANLLTKLTTVSAVLFMVIALTLSILSARRAGSSRSVLDEVPAPAIPAAPASEPGSIAPAPVDEPAAGDTGAALPPEPESQTLPADPADTP